MDTDILNEQIAYYRAQAPEYDEVTENTEELKEAYARARELLQRMGPYEQVLELACGTGTWTQVLLPIAHDITAIDAAPEMLAIARQKLGNAYVSYQQADVFQWEPRQEYDLVFFANWLSHVLPKDLNAFLRKVSRAVRPGGHLVMIDQSAPTSEDREIMTEREGGSLYAHRSLRNGEAFIIVKVFYEVTPTRCATRWVQVAQRREIEASICSPFPVDNPHFSKVYFFLVSKPTDGLLTRKKG